MVAIPKKPKQKRRLSSSIVSAVQVSVAVIGGLFSGAFVANVQLSTGRILASAANPQQQQQQLAAAPPRPDTSGCHLPAKAKKMTIPAGEAGSYIELAVWNDGAYMTEQLEKDGFWEIIEPSGMADLGDTTLPTGDSNVFWDIGANIGYYSFMFAAAGYRVIAFEPENTNAALFRASLCLNPTLAKKIELVPKALTSDGPKKECKIVAQAKAERMKRYLHLIPRLICDTHCKRIHSICQDVALTTLDEASKEFPPPNVLKMDVEGHELAVFKGGTQRFFQNNPPVIIQFENRDSRTEDEIAKLLEENGYRVSDERGHDSNTVAVLSSYQPEEEDP